MSPELIVDAHHHLWDPGARSYPWMTGPDLEPIRRPYTLEDLRRETAAAGVQRTVLVQTVSEIDETRGFLATARASSGLVAGVVGWVDLTGDVAGQVAVFHRGGGGDLLAGLRHQVEDEPDPCWLARPEVRRGLAAAGDLGLVYDLLVRPDQVAAARDALADLPGATFVLDHCAKPEIASGRLDPWRAQLSSLAELPNVVCKLSGLTTQADWRRWTVEELAPYVQFALDAFGADRVMVGTDWPVSELAGTYGETVTALVDLVEGAGLTPGDQGAVLGGTAERVYGLGRNS